MVRVDIGDWKRIEKLSLPSYFASRIREDLTFDNPEYTGLIKHRRGLAIGMLKRGEALPPKKLFFYSEDSDYFWVPREYSIPDEQIQGDYRVRVAAEYPEPLLGLRDIQRDALAAWEKSGCGSGVYVLGTGAGKTIVGLEMGRRLKQRLLVLTNRDAAGLDNWVKDCQKYLGFEPGVIQGDAVQYGDSPVVVAMFQTLWSRKELLDEIKGLWGVVVVDECQHVPATTFCQVSNSFFGAVRIGLTATPRRSDGMEAITFASLGGIAFERNRAEEIVPVSVKIVRTGLLMPEVEQARDYTKALARLTLNDARNELIARKAVEVGGGRHSLVISHRIRHAKILANLIAAQVGPENVGVMVGSVKESKKSKTKPVTLMEGIRSKPSEVKKLAKEGKLAYVCATYQFVAEGLDIPVWDTLHLATPSKNEIEIKQVLGRIRRAYPGKEKAWVLDYADASGMFVNFFYARQRVYKKMAAEAEKEGRERQGNLF